MSTTVPITRHWALSSTLYAQHARMTPALVHLVFLSCLVLSLVPLWAVEAPPLFDYPNHLSRAHVLATIDTSPTFAHHFEVSSYLIPNALCDAVTVALTQVVEIELAGRLTLGIILALILSGTYVLNFTTTGKFRIWPLLASVFLYNEMMLWGFTNYMLGLGLLLWALASWVSLEKRSRLGQIIAGSVFALLIFLSHLVAFGIYAIAIGLIELRRAWLNQSYSLVRMLSALCASALQFLLPAILFFTASPSSSLPLGMRFDFTAFGKLSPFTRLLSSGNTAMDLLVLCGVVLVLATSLATRRLTIDGRLLLVTAGLLVLTLILPYTALGSYFLDSRVPIVAVLVFLSGLRPTAAGRRSMVGVTLIVLGLLSVRTFAISRDWQAQEQHYAAILEAFDRLPEGSFLIPAATYRFQHAANWVNTRTMHPPHEHLASYATVRRDVIVPSIFARAGQNPLVFKPQGEAVGRVQRNPILRVRNVDDIGRLIDEAAAIADGPGHPRVYSVIYGLGCNSQPKDVRIEQVSCGDDFVIFGIASPTMDAVQGRPFSASVKQPMPPQRFE